ncbi:MAG TPA: protein kinase [Gemmatimonadaceae bacterium]|nr:protein kinase [Gemmatimonadaceae bacterium]
MATDLREQLQQALGAAYTLDRELGGGGMSRVFTAHDESLGRAVVVKVLPPELATLVSAERFRREVRLLAPLQHPHIVPLFAAGESDALPHYVMQYVEGESLRDRLARERQLPVADALRIARDVADALAYAHARGVVHRDIKPANILLTASHAVVADFGIARAVSRAVDRAAADTLTSTGLTPGTPEYMSPEQAAGERELDGRSDLHSLGAVLYEMLIGEPPFAAPTMQATIARVVSERAPAVRDRRPAVPAAVGDIVARCLEKSPADRPASAAALCDELTRALVAIEAGGRAPGDASHLDVSGAGSNTSARPRASVGTAVIRPLATYIGALAVVVLLARVATATMGLPDWVVPGALLVMAAGLPVVLATMVALSDGAGARTTSGDASRHWGVARLRRLLTWRRATVGGVLALSAFTLVVIAYMASRALGVGPAASLLAAGVVREREPILVADFHSPAPDSALGLAAAEAMRIALGESRAVLVASPASVGATLRRMGRGPGMRVDGDVAREVARRDGIRAIVQGGVARVGGGYLITARLLPTGEGAELASFAETASSADEIIPAVGKLARRLRGKVGESLKLVAAAPPLDRVTTSSLEALSKYSDALRARFYENDPFKGIALMEEAIGLDSTFAMAMRAVASWSAAEGLASPRTDSLLAAAYRLRHRLTERERYLTTGSYFQDVDRQRSIAAYQAAYDRDSTDFVAIHQLAFMLWSRREFARAETLYRREVALHPHVSLGYLTLASVQIGQGKYAAAESTAAELRRRFPADPLLVPIELRVGLRTRSLDSTIATIASLRDRTGVAGRRRAVAELSSLEYRRGRLAEARRLLAELQSLAAAQGAPLMALDLMTLEAEEDIFLRSRAGRGTAKIVDAVRLPLPRNLFVTHPARGDRPAYLGIASLLARSGRPDGARAILARYDAEITDSTRRRVEEPTRHEALAELALIEGDIETAVREFHAADMRPDGPVDGCTICLFERLARAHDAAGRPDSAIAMFERYLTTPFAGRHLLDDLHLARTYERLAELYEAAGDRERAVTYYEAFIDLWKAADPELQPRVARARTRLTRLQGLGTETSPRALQAGGRRDFSEPTPRGSGRHARQ